MAENQNVAASVVVGVDGSRAAIDAALWAVDEAVGREAGEDRGGDPPWSMTKLRGATKGSDPLSGLTEQERVPGDLADSSVTSGQPIQIE